MNVNELLYKKFINVGINDIQISTNEKPIIGTIGLGPCMSFILYNQENKKAIVGHISCSKLMDNINLQKLRLQILKVISQNKLINSSFDLILIEGAQKSMYHKEWYELEILQNLEKKKYSLFEVLKENLKNIDLINITSINKLNFSIDDIQIVDTLGKICNEKDNETSKQFAFNANTGKFITNDIFYCKENEETKKY